MIAKRDDATDLFRALCDQHGIGVDDLVGGAVIRALSRELAKPDVDPAIVNGLTGLLPPKRVKVGEADPRLRRLSDVELYVLQFLVGRLDGRPLPDASAELTPWDECTRLRRDLAALEERASRLAHENDDLSTELTALKASQQQPAPAAAEALPSPSPSPSTAEPAANVVPLFVNGDNGPACDTSHWGRW